jgi:hypothetical protein
MSLYPLPATTSVNPLVFQTNLDSIYTTIYLTPDMNGMNMIITRPSGSGGLTNFNTTALTSANTPAGWYINLKLGVTNSGQNEQLEENLSPFRYPRGGGGNTLYGNNEPYSGAAIYYLYWNGTYLMLY